jgi:hypothetical protein
MTPVRLPLRVVLNATAPRYAPPAYRPTAGFLLDAQQPKLPNAPDKGYPSRPRKKNRA